LADGRIERIVAGRLLQFLNSLFDNITEEPGIHLLLIRGLSKKTVISLLCLFNLLTYSLVWSEFSAGIYQQVAQMARAVVTDICQMFAGKVHPRIRDTSFVVGIGRTA
jgi:hypothetical protein